MEKSSKYAQAVADYWAADCIDQQRDAVRRLEAFKEPKLIYIAGSMRNRDGILRVSKVLREAGFDIFNDWIMPGEETDDKWQEFARADGLNYFQAMESPHVWDVFEFDKTWLDAAWALMVVGPVGKSGHAELGYARGSGKPVVLYQETEPERWDIMARFAHLITSDLDEAIEWLKNRT